MTLGYDRKPLHGYEEAGVEKRIDVSDLKGDEARLWNRSRKLLGMPKVGIWNVYLDGSLTPKLPIAHLVEEWLGNADVAFFKHPHRTCAYAEIDACVARNKITAEQGEKARAFLMLQGFPRDFGLWACGMIARRSHANAFQEFVSPLWWTYTREMPRDQVWLPFALWKIRDSLRRVRTIDLDIFDNHLFSFRRHGT